MVAPWFETFFDEDYAELLDAQKPPSLTRSEAAFAKKVLGLKRGDRVLDAPCGFGRHSTAFAEAGMKVVGVDLSPAMLTRAAKHRNIEYKRLDLRELPFEAEFDAATCLFSSFGYFTPAQNQRAMDRLIAALKPGARVLLDLPHPRRYRGQPVIDETLPWPGGRTMREEATFDKKTGIYSGVWTFLWGDKVTSSRVHFHLYTVPQMRAIFKAAGAELEEVYDDFRATVKAGPSSVRLCYVARRTA